MEFGATFLILLCSLSVSSNAEFFSNISYHWTVSLSDRFLLGVHKQVIVINDQFPGPVLNATTNDVVSITIYNKLPEPFLMTWNGVQLRRNSWQDGVAGTNCPIPPGKNWTYSFEMKDQTGSFFYYPTLNFQKAGGGYGAIRVHNRDVIPLPFPKPCHDFDVLIGDWYSADHRHLRALLDEGKTVPMPDGILINGLGPKQAIFEFKPGATYRLRISNVGLKTSLNFRIEDHLLQLVEAEGSYTVQKQYSNLDIHVGQSYSVLVTAKKECPNPTNGMSCFFMIASSRFTESQLFGIGVVRYPGSTTDPYGLLPTGPFFQDYQSSLDQSRSIRWDLKVGAARPNPQGSYHYGSINISHTLVLQNGVVSSRSRLFSTVNGVSYVDPGTPLKLADHFKIKDVFGPGVIPERPTRGNVLSLRTSVIYANRGDFYHIVFQNPTENLQSWHLDGYNFFVVGMDYGTWDESKISTYNMIDAIYRSTVEVYPKSWTAILVMLDNEGMWNLRSQDSVMSYLGQELYIRVKGVGEDDLLSIPERVEAPIPCNVILCGLAVSSRHP